MTDSFERFKRTFEIFANEQAAEIEAVRAVLQGFLVNILANHPEGGALFQGLRDDVIARLENETTQPGNDQDATRKAQFVLTRANQIFDEMAPVFGIGSPVPPDKKN